jgi:hypothetical protein
VHPPRFRGAFEVTSHEQSHPAVSLIGAVYLAASILLFLGCAARAQSGLAYQDGLLVRAAVVGSELELSWRFLHPMTVPLDAVTVAVNGRPLGLPRIRPYPQPGDLTLLAFLLDISDPARAEEIASNTSLLLGALGVLKPHHRAGIIVYGADADLLVAQSKNADDLVNAILDIVPRDEKVNRDEAIMKAIVALGNLPAARRALFVLTDGHTDSAVRTNDVIRLAVEHGVTITFVVANAAGVRSIDPESVIVMAIGSGGDVITRDEQATFVADPFTIVDSGAEVIFPLAGSFRLPWETGLNATVRLTYGAKALELNVPVNLPAAGPKQIIDGVAGSPVLLGVGMAVFALLLLFAVLIVRRWRKRAKAARPKEILRETRPAVRAMLQNTADGSAYPLQAAEIRLGRGSSNDVVLSDETGSRLHALLRSDGDGYAIENMSEVNGTVVNGALVDKASLANGDLITLGKTTFRFVVVRN